MAREFLTDRRAWLRNAAIGIGAAAGSMSDWLGSIAAGAPKKPARSVIVLWLNGGPATIDLWDLKPGHANGGPFKEIATTAPGLKIGEHLPKVARWGKEMAVVRSMSTKEGDHARAMFLLRTGYLPQGAVQFPAVGAVLARELGAEAADLPNFVSIAPVRYGETGSGFLGPRFAPLVIGEQADYGLTVPDLARTPGVSDAAQTARLDLLKDMEKGFAAGREAPVAGSIQAATARAVRLMRPEAAAAFRLEDEKAKTRDAYGPSMSARGVCSPGDWSNAASRSSKSRSTDGTRTRTTSIA